MIGKKCLVAMMVLATINAQSSGSCVPSATQAAYGLVSQSASIVSNGTCKDYFSTNGACATPGSVINAMNNHNAWLANKAHDAQLYGLQYINATVYFQQQNGVITTSTQPASSSSWWGSVTSTLSSWWNTISNRATGLFKSAVAWVQNVFNNNMANIPNCLQAWGNITNGAYCLAASASNVNYTTSLNGANGDLAWGVDQTSTGAALASCESLIDTYCQLTYGRSINNDTFPFNTTFNWNDGGISVDTCNNLRTYKKCNGNTCQPNLYDTYIGIFESYFIRFIPSRDSINRLGQFLNTTQAPSTYTATTAASSGKSFRLYTAASGANIRAIGGNSGQPGQSYNVNSAFNFLATLAFALFALLV